MSEKFNEQTNDLIERYVYDVTRRISEKQRKDIGDELRGLIEDMIMVKLEEQECKGLEGKSEEEITREVLNHMGNPSKLARKYRGDEEHLIGGEYYDTYCLVLKIVLIVATFGCLVSGIVSIILEVAIDSGVGVLISDDIFHFAELPGVLISLFGAITLLFALMERAKVKLGGSLDWDISKLPIIPVKQVEIKRIDCIISIVFDVLFACIFLFAPFVLGAWIVEAGKTTCIPIFDLTIWPSVLPLFIISFMVEIIRDIAKLIEGCYNKIVFIISMLANAVSIVCTVLLFRGYHVWNSDFVSQLKTTVTGRNFLEEGIQIQFSSATIETLLMCVIIGAILLDTLVTICKTIKSKGGTINR